MEFICYMFVWEIIFVAATEILLQNHELQAS